MNQVLSQNEVEALLRAASDESGLESMAGDGVEGMAALGTGPNAARGTLNIDRRFDEVRPILEDLLDKTTRGFRNFLLGALAREISVERFSIEMVHFQDFTRRYDLYGRPYTFLAFEVSQASHVGLIIFEPALAVGLMEGFMGGALEDVPAPTWRPLTTLELKVAERTNRELLAALGRALSERVPVTVTGSAILTNAHLVRGLREISSVVVAGIRVIIRGKTLGECYVLLPHDVMDVIVQHEAPKSEVSPEVNAEWDHSLEDGVNHIEVAVSAELGSTVMSVSRFISLKVGDLITLENARPGVATVRIGGVPKIMAMPGVYRGRRALRILS